MRRLRYVRPFVIHDLSHAQVTHASHRCVRRRQLSCTRKSRASTAAKRTMYMGMPIFARLCAAQHTFTNILRCTHVWLTPVDVQISVLIPLASVEASLAQVVYTRSGWIAGPVMSTRRG